jgi:hypothetical protein
LAPSTPFSIAFPAEAEIGRRSVSELASALQCLTATRNGPNLAHLIDGQQTMTDWEPRAMSVTPAADESVPRRSISEPVTPWALLISGDLMTGSQVLGVARQQGLLVHQAMSTAAAVERLTEPGLIAILIDLNTQRNLEEIIPSIPQRDHVHVVAFGPHVQPQWLQAAKDAGANAALPRSRFQSVLRELLTEVFANRGSSELKL